MFCSVKKNIKVFVFIRRTLISSRINAFKSLGFFHLKESLVLVFMERVRRTENVYGVAESLCCRCVNLKGM